MARLPSDVRKPQIANAALMLLARDGARGFTTGALAQAVGLSEAAIFRHFPTKNAILDAAVTELEGLLFPNDKAPPPEGALETLHAFLESRAAILSERPGVLRILFSNEIGRAGSAETAERVTALRQRSIAVLSALLKRAMKEGQIRDDLSVSELVALVQGLILSLAFHIDGEATPDAFKSAWATFIRLVGRQGVTE